MSARDELPEGAVEVEETTECYAVGFTDGVCWALANMDEYVALMHFSESDDNEKFEEGLMLLSQKAAAMFIEHADQRFQRHINSAPHGRVAGLSIAEILP